MATADHTSPACPSDRNDPLSQSPPPLDGMLPTRSLDQDQRTFAMEQGDPYMIAVLAIERVLRAHYDFVPPSLPPGVRMCGQLLPLDAAQLYGLNTALHVLRQYVVSIPPTRGG
ncbi:hypothetical protein [Dyella acidiphila]|uniref:Uncharacterized protein n=1 Tax=Dyella acidiphila TaxID=2775866 RepID=A0ABR9G6A3_9GAMM|nr:hypothetical protein [Dyella acidiphila]MBE1159561.1 hypothetical protein [Dyella acidiphila]